jgi:hypothetical protein
MLRQRLDVLETKLQLKPPRRKAKRGQRAPHSAARMSLP